MSWNCHTFAYGASYTKCVQEKGKEKAYQAVDKAADKASEKAKQPSMLAGAVMGAFLAGGTTAYYSDLFINKPYRSYKPAMFAAVFGAGLGAWSCSRFAERMIEKHVREPGKEMVDQVVDQASGAVKNVKGLALEKLEERSMGLVKKSKVEQVLDAALEPDSGLGR